MEVVDRFNVLSEHLQQGLSRRRFRRIIQEESQPLQDSLLRRLIALAPDGSDWTDPPEVFENRERFYEQRSPRPSLRQHGMTLRQGWQSPRLDFIGSTRTTVRSSISVQNIAPHMRYILNGTDRPVIFRRDLSGLDDNKQLFFHWFRRNVTVWPLVVQNHPGTQPNNFPERAIDQLEPDVEDFNDRVQQRIIEGLRPNG